MKDESRPALGFFRPSGAPSSNGASSNGAHPTDTKAPPANVAVKCPECRELLVSKDWEKNLKVCTKCGYHFRLSARERIDLILDPGSFVEIAQELQSSDPLGFVSRSTSYATKLEEERQKTGMNEGVLAGTGTIEEVPLALAVMDFRFIGGSMGSVVGEKITRAIELAAEQRMPVLVVSASGGARMQEGLLSLMQMAKTSAALGRLAQAGQPYISLLTDPTSGGVTASFAMLGDINLAEPGALIVFTGPRVIEQFIHQRLPKDTGSAEFVLEHGMIDGIVHRRALRATLGRILKLYAGVVPQAR